MESGAIVKCLPLSAVGGGEIGIGGLSPGGLTGVGKTEL